MADETEKPHVQRFLQFVRKHASTGQSKLNYLGELATAWKGRVGLPSQSGDKTDLGRVESNPDGGVLNRLRKAEIQQKVEAWRVVLLATIAGLGLFSLFLSLVLPEWFVLIQFGGSVQGHIGYFQRCVYGPGPGPPNCFHEIISEAAAPVGLFLISIICGFGSILFGARRLFLTRCKPAPDDAKSSTYQRMRSLLLVSGTSCTCGVSVFTYLYHDYLVPISASYVLGWLASFLLLFGGIIGFCFKNKSSSKPSVTPAVPLSWNRRDSKGNSKQTSTSPSRNKTSIATVSTPRRQSLSSCETSRPKFTTRHSMDASLR